MKALDQHSTTTMSGFNSESDIPQWLATSNVYGSAMSVKGITESEHSVTLEEITVCPLKHPEVTLDHAHGGSATKPD